MKYTNFTVKQKELLNAFIQGKILESKAGGESWIELTESNFMTCLVYYEVRIKPKEPVVKYTLFPIFIDGVIDSVYSHSSYSSIKEIGSVFNDSRIHSLLIKTYHDGKFVKAEVIPKLEAWAKGLM